MSSAIRNSRRVVATALDMGDGGLIQHWARAGHLPRFRELIDEGTWVDLESPARTSSVRRSGVE
jgi:hypothetical protein